MLKSQEKLASFLLYQLDGGRGPNDIPNDVHEVDPKERKKSKERLEKKRDRNKKMGRKNTRGDLVSWW